MTFNEIQKEFMRRFPMPMKRVERMRDLGINVAYTTVEERLLEEREWNIAMNDWNNHRGFLKQSFIKYLQDEVDWLKTQYQDEHPVDCIDGVTPVETYGYEETYNQAISDQITYYKTQIKELEV